MKELKTIVIRLDFLQGPIWISDPETGEPLTGIEIVDTDKTVRELNIKIQNMYDSYYEFDSHDQPCWFDHEKEKAEKDIMLDLISRLISRLDEINDGSFTVENHETERLKNL